MLVSGVHTLPTQRWRITFRHGALHLNGTVSEKLMTLLIQDRNWGDDPVTFRDQNLGGCRYHWHAQWLQWLCRKVQTALKNDPMFGHVFLFRSRSASQVKLLGPPQTGCACSPNCLSAGASHDPLPVMATCTWTRHYCPSWWRASAGDNLYDCWDPCPCCKSFDPGFAR